MLLLCAYCGVVQAQDYFIKTININETSSDNGFNVIADETGYMVMCGSLFNGNTSSGVGIFKTDLQGDKILENAFSTALDTHAYDFLKMTNGNFVVSAYTATINDDWQDTFIKVKANGDSLNATYHGGDIRNGSASIMTSGNKIIALSSYGIINDYSHLVLMEIDTSLHLLDEYLIEDTENYNFNIAVDITLLPTNEYVLGIGAQNEANKIYGYIRKIDTIGTTLWEKKLSNVASSVAPIHLATLQNGNFVVSWIELLGGETENRGSYFVRCYNAAGDSVWQHTFLSVDYGRNIQDLHVCSNGDIIGCGYTGNFSITGNPTSWLFRLSPQGELRWLREYAYWQAIGNTMLLYGITEDPYGDIIATGFAGVYNNLGNVDGQAVLLKVNNMGCFGNGGCNDTTIVSSVVTGIEEASPQPPPKEGGHILPLEGGVRGGLWVYPNPTNDILSVLTPQEWLPPQSILQIHDMAGRLVKTITVIPNNHGFSTFAVTDLPNGLYILNLSADGVRLAQAKMVVQH